MPYAGNTQFPKLLLMRSPFPWQKSCLGTISRCDSFECTPVRLPCDMHPAPVGGDVRIFFRDCMHVKGHFPDGWRFNSVSAGTPGAYPDGAHYGIGIEGVASMFVLGGFHLKHPLGSPTAAETQEL